MINWTNVKGRTKTPSYISMIPITKRKHHDLLMLSARNEFFFQLFPQVDWFLSQEQQDGKGNVESNLSPPRYGCLRLLKKKSISFLVTD